jgi:ABC-type lipoprotein release transport system permease subunit
MRQFFLIAFRNLTAHRSRNLMLGGAIAFTSLTLTLLLGVTAGIQGTLKEATMTLHSGSLNVNGFYKLSAGSWAPFMNKRKAVMADVREVMPEATEVIDRYMGYGKVVAEKASLESPMWGVDMAAETKALKLLKAADEKEFGKSDLSALGQPGTAALYAKQARKLEVKVGDLITLSLPTQRNTNNTKDAKVVAVLRDWGMMSSFSLMISKSDLQQIYQTGDDSTGQVLLYLKDGTDLVKAENKLRKGLEAKGWSLRERDGKAVFMKFQDVAAEPWVGLKLDLTSWEDESSYMKWLILLLNAIFVSVTLILLFIIAMGVMNAMYIAVTERTREIGTLRAIGMRSRSVLGLVVLEGFLLAAMACAAGMAVGVALGWALTALHIPLPSEAVKSILLSETLIISTRVQDLLLTFGAITLLTTAGAFFPAWKASRLKPLTAIQAPVA